MEEESEISEVKRTTQKKDVEISDLRSILDAKFQKKKENWLHRKLEKYKQKEVFVNRWKKEIFEGDQYTFKADFLKHFRHSCLKCGHSSHQPFMCKVYPGPIENSPRSLCLKCGRGLHRTRDCMYISVGSEKDLQLNWGKSFEKQTPVSFEKQTPRISRWDQRKRVEKWTRNCPSRKNETLSITVQQEETHRNDSESQPVEGTPEIQLNPLFPEATYTYNRSYDRYKDHPIVVRKDAEAKM